MDGHPSAEGVSEAGGSSRRGERTRFELEPFAALDTVQDVWPALAERSGNMFASWEWVSTWWHHFGGERALLGALARRGDGEPVAILPLYEFTRRPLRILRFLGHGPGDWLGPIHAPEDSEVASAALESMLAITRSDLLLAERLRADLEGIKAGTVLRREGFPMLPFRGRTWDQVLEGRSSNFRQQVRRRERRLARSHTLEYRLCTEPQRLDADLDLLFRLHGARWSTGDSSAFAGAREAFHRDFARLALERGWLRLWIMELDGVAVAAWYGFRYAGVEWYYQAGRDPARDADSVGFVLLCHTIRAACEDGAAGYWFLRGGEAYKDRFAEEDPGLLTTSLARGWRGRAAIAAASGFGRLPSPARRWARARLG